jgi:hypothetical protein
MDSPYPTSPDPELASRVMGYSSDEAFDTDDGDFEVEEVSVSGCWLSRYGS